jgi:hypothetical protein
VGNFFEYHFSPSEFASAVAGVGFEIREHVPLGHIDGVFHEITLAVASHRASEAMEHDLVP